MSDTTTNDLSTLEATAVEAQAVYEAVKDDRNVDFMVRQEASWAAARARVALLDTKVGVEGRTAVCSCSKTHASTHDLFGFTYRGPGSDWAAKRCGAVAANGQPCCYAPVAHGAVNVGTGRPGITHHDFTPSEPLDTDTYYCGCRGWD